MTRDPDLEDRAVRLACAELSRAVAARKCHPCGCLHGTLALLEGTGLGRADLTTALAEARGVLEPEAYDCLGCAVCYPALACSALSEAFSEVADTNVACASDAAVAQIGRQGWPPLPGAYHVIRYAAPVAVCTLNSDALAEGLAQAAPEGLAIVGTLRTENLGVERVVRNVLANPNVRMLVVCGEDAQQAVGHLPGQSLLSLLASGIDASGRIRDARGARPVLKNVGVDEVAAFRRQVEPVSLIGEVRQDVILRAIAGAAARDPGPVERPAVPVGLETIRARAPRRFVPDPAGFVVIYADPRGPRLVAEHYDGAGALDSVVEGTSASAVYTELIERRLISRLDHAAYLGRELERAERSLRTGEPYVQDRAPGQGAGPAAPHGGPQAPAPPEG